MNQRKDTSSQSLFSSFGLWLTTASWIAKSPRWHVLFFFEKGTLAWQFHSSFSHSSIVEAFIYRDAAENFVSASLLEKVAWTIEPLLQAYEATINGAILSSGLFSLCTTPVKMSLRVLHLESFSSPQAFSKLVLGFPSLQKPVFASPVGFGISLSCQVSWKGKPWKKSWREQERNNLKFIWYEK